jgi:hypothetical protein
MSDTALFLVLPPSLAHLPCWGEFTKRGVTIHVSSRLPRISKQERAFLRVKARTLRKCWMRKRYHAHRQQRRQYQ